MVLGFLAGDGGIGEVAACAVHCFCLVGVEMILNKSEAVFSRLELAGC
jgi:hypothetical protein